jgi:hypothetical protein
MTSRGGVGFKTLSGEGGEGLASHHCHDLGVDLFRKIHGAKDGVRITGTKATRCNDIGVKGRHAFFQSNPVEFLCGTIDDVNVNVVELVLEVAGKRQ